MTNAELQEITTRELTLSELEKINKAIAERDEYKDRLDRIVALENITNKTDGWEVISERIHRMGAIARGEDQE